MKEKKPKPPKMLEKNITKDIREELKRHGIFHWKNWAGLGSKPGVSDILGVLPDGKLLAIEVKTPAGMKRTEARRKAGEKIPQDFFHFEVARNGGVAFYATSSLDVFQALRSLGFVK